VRPLGLWRDFMREWGRSLQAALHNPGDIAGTLSESKKRREVETFRHGQLQQQGDVLRVAAQIGSTVDQALEQVKQKNGGVLPPKLRRFEQRGFILGGYEALFVFFETDDMTRIDIYYGGDEGVVDGNNHGHIIIRRGRMEAWWAHGANKEKRIKII
jgi:hypothetical protein